MTEHLHTAETLGNLMRTTGLILGTTYYFRSRAEANAAEVMLRAETAWTVEWVGPQAFTVY